MAVVSERFSVVRVLGCRKNGLTQYIVIGQSNTEDRLENPRLVTPFTMSVVQHIVLDLCTEIDLFNSKSTSLESWAAS